MVGKVGELKWGITESEQSQTRGGGEVMRKLQEKWSIPNKWLSGPSTGEGRSEKLRKRI